MKETYYKNKHRPDSKPPPGLRIMKSVYFKRNYKGNLLKTQPQTRFETAPCAGPCAGLARALRGVLRGRFCPAGPGSALKKSIRKTTPSGRCAQKSCSRHHRCSHYITFISVSYHFCRFMTEPCAESHRKGPCAVGKVLARSLRTLRGLLAV